MNPKICEVPRFVKETNDHLSEYKPRLLRKW